LPIGETLASLPTGKWVTLGVPLKCFATAGADMRKLDSVLRLETSGKLQLSVSRLALGASNESQHTLDCAR
jgi:beta-glucosidase